MSQRLLNRQPFARLFFMEVNYLLLRTHIFNDKNVLISALTVTFFTFFIALLVSIGAESLVSAVNSVLVSIPLLILIILVGVFFDMIGTAATAAVLPPFNARAAKKVYGARQAVKITRNASKVANFCNDVIGDIAGTLSGAIGAGIVLSLVDWFGTVDLFILGGMMTSLIAALTVGGKAAGKKVAIDHANAIIFRVAVIMARWEDLTGMELFNDKR